MKSKLVLALVTVMLLATSLVATIAQAEAGPTITFEPPTYATGTIHGQDGWSSSNPNLDHAVTSQSIYPSFGNQSLRISNAFGTGSFGDQTFSKPLVDEAGEADAANDGMSGGARQPLFEAQWDFASATPDTYQANLSVVASPDRGDGARMSWVEMTDTPTGLAVNFYDYQADYPDTYKFVLTNVASDLDRTVPHTIRITMEFVDGPANDIVTVSVDDTWVHTGTSWEDYYRNEENNPTRTVDSILFRTSVAAPANLGNGFLIDNLALQSGNHTPAEMIDNLQNATAELVDHQKTERTLLAALDRAERFMESRPQVARLALFQYILQVRLYDAFGLIDGDAADQLIQQAQQLSESLS